MQIITRCNSAITFSAADFTRRGCIAICARKTDWFILWIRRSHVGLTRGVYQVEYACDPPNVSKARAVILRDLADMQTKKVTRAGIASGQVDAAARHSAGRIERGLHRQRLADVFRRSDLPLDERVRAGKIYAKLDAGDVKKAFAKWLRADGLVQVTQGPRSRIKAAGSLAHRLSDSKKFISVRAKLFRAYFYALRVKPANVRKLKQYGYEHEFKQRRQKRPELGR